MGTRVALVIGLGLAALVGCGSGTLGGGDGGGGTGQNNGCAALGACACAAASDVCTARTEACYCPTECDPSIACVCGGGRFLACEEKPITSMPPYCSIQLLTVQQRCAGTAFVNWIGDLCPTQTDSCVGSCLANLGSCAEIDCSFCPACDCAVPPPSPFRDCLAACRSLR